jgi:hypothetical protein
VEKEIKKDKDSFKINIDIIKKFMESNLVCDNKRMVSKLQVKIDRIFFLK